MRSFSVSVHIAAPAERVVEVMTAVEQWPEWTQSVTSVELLTPGPLAPGSRARIRQPGFPPAVWTVSGVRPGISFTWTSPGPGFTVVGTHHVEPRGDGCTATLSLEFRGVLGGLFGRLTSGVNRRYIAYEAEGLKRRSESTAARSEERSCGR